MIPRLFGRIEQGQWLATHRWCPLSGNEFALPRTSRVGRKLFGSRRVHL